MGEGWWLAADGKWYAPELHPNYVAPATTAAPQAAPTPPTTPPAPGWWLAADGNWYAPEQHPNYVAPPTATAADPAAATQTLPIVPDGPGTPDRATTAPAQTPNPAYGATPLAGRLDQPGPSFLAPGSHPETVAPVSNQQTPQPDTTATSSPRRGLVLALAAVVLIAVLGFLAFRFLGGGSSAGGAASPSEAVDQLIASINEADPVGFVDVFDPDEIGSLVDAATSATEAQGDTVDIQDQLPAEVTELRDSIDELLGAIDYNLSGPNGEPVTYTVTPLDDEGRIVRVRVDALVMEVTSSAEPEALIASMDNQSVAVRTDVIDGARVEMQDSSSGLELTVDVPGADVFETDFADDVHLDLVTIEKDGAWFISYGYSALESIRGAAFSGLPQPDYGRAFNRLDSGDAGAESPEAVVQQLATASESLDYGTLIELVDPLALPYLHDYQPLIDAQVDQQDLQDAAREMDLQLEPLSLEVDDWEGHTLVVINDIQGMAGDINFSVDVEQWCITQRDSFGEDTVCVAEGIQELLDFFGSEPTNPQDFLPERLGFIVIERDGRWFLDVANTWAFVATEIGDAASESGVTVPSEFSNNVPFAGIGGDLSITTGPIAAVNAAAQHLAEAGTAAIAIDLSDADRVSTDAGEISMALIQVTTDDEGSYHDSLAEPLSGNDWFVVWDDDPADEMLPAVTADTDGSIAIELFAAEPIEIGEGTTDGQFDAEGRPQVFTISTPDDRFQQIQVNGATGRAVFPWARSGVSLPGQVETFLDAGALFIIATGEPNEAFTISVGSTTTEVPPAAPPPATRAPFSSQVAEDFASIVEPAGFTFVVSEPGGFFDGCNGPDDPTAVSHSFENISGASLVVSVYATADQAASQFQLLENLTTPCDGTDIRTIDRLDAESILISWTTPGLPDDEFFELYRLHDDAIAVALSEEVPEFDQLDLIEQWVLGQ